MTRRNVFIGAVIDLVTSNSKVVLMRQHSFSNIKSWPSYYYVNPTLPMHLSNLHNIIKKSAQLKIFRFKTCIVTNMQQMKTVELQPLLNCPSG